MKEECPANLTFEVVDATALPYENDSFDVMLIANDFQNFTDVQGI